MKIYRMIPIVLAVLAPLTMGQVQVQDIEEIGAAPAASTCYTTNCTGSDIRGRRGCYLCCAADCTGGTKETDCQEDCDGAWVRTVGDAIPRDLLNEIVASKHDAAAQHQILTDAGLWDWFVVDGRVGWEVVSIADFLLDNAANEANERLALVTLAWLAQEHQVDLIGREIVRDGLYASLYSQNAGVRAGAIIGLRESGFLLTDPALMIETIRIMASDPSDQVREIGIQVVSKVR